MIISKDILIGIVLALLIAGAVGGFNYWKGYQEKKLDEIAALVYLYEKGDLKEEEVRDKVKGTPYYVYFLSLTSDNPSEIIKHLGDEELRKLFLEKEAFNLYRKKKYAKALEKLQTVDKGSFNYPSALLLKAFIYEAQNRKKEAKSIYEELIKDFGKTYFGRIAYGRFLLLKEG